MEGEERGKDSKDYLQTKRVISRSMKKEHIYNETRVSDLRTKKKSLKALNLGVGKLTNIIDKLPFT